MAPRARAPVLAALLIAALSVAAPAQENDGEGVRETTQPRVELSTFRAEVRPEFEVVLPTGAITQSIPLQFGRLGIDTTLGYAVNGNQLDGEMLFSYDVWRLRPTVRFFQNVDFEDYVDPRLGTSGVDVFSDEQFISRRRGFEPGVAVTVLPHTRVGTAVGVTDTFEWSLANDELIDEGIDLVPQVFIVYDNMRALDPNRVLEFSGVAGRIALSQRFRNDFDNPVTLELQNRLLLQYLLGPNWEISEHITFDTLLRNWNKELARLYQLGGFDSIRGYAPNEIEAARAGMLSTRLSRRILRRLDTRFQLHRRRRVTIHQYRVFTFADVALTQKRMSLESDVSLYSSAGLGIGTVVSSGRIHLDVSLSAAQPLESGRLPVFYLRTTLFNLERRL